LISKKVVNHCYWAKGEDTKVIANCLDKSLKNKNVFIFHTANDSELTSTAIKTVLKKHHVVHSLCDTGSSWENAIVESFFASLVRWTKINKSWNQKWKRNDIEQMIDEFIVQYNQLQDYRNSRKQLKDNQPQHRKFVDEYLTTVYLV
jgi:transposase InsO family protein